MCLSKDHQTSKTEIKDKTKNGINGKIPLVVEQAVHCHFFYNPSTLEKCAQHWGMSVPDVTMVFTHNIEKFGKYYDKYEEGVVIELIPNNKFFKFADKAEAGLLQNLVYDFEAIRHERDRRAPIEKALKTSDLFHDSTFTVSDFELCLDLASLIRGQNLKKTDLEIAIKAAPLLRDKNITTVPVLKMCLDAPPALQKIENLSQEWNERIVRVIRQWYETANEQ